MPPFALLLLACAPDPGEVPDECEPGPLEPGEVRAKQVACDDELFGGEGRVGDWLLENATARFIIRDLYSSLTQLGEPGGTLVDAAMVGGTDLLMELDPEGDRSTIAAATLDGAAEVQLPGITYHLDADEPRLSITSPDGTALTGVWVPKPGVDHVDATARRDGWFFALELTAPLEEAADDLGQLPISGLTGVSLTPAARWPDGDTLALEVDADAIDILDGSRALDRVPVQNRMATSQTPLGATLRPTREGCAYAGLQLTACGGLAVRVQDEVGAPLNATVHFGGADFALAPGGGRAPLGIDPGEVWVWAGPRYSAWKGWFSGGEDEVFVTLTRELPAEIDWPHGAGPASPADFPSGGTLLADLAVLVAPDATYGRPARDARSANRGEGVGLELLLADDEVPVYSTDPRDPALTLVGSRAGGDAWAWGWTSTNRRAGHGALDWLGFDALDRLTLVRGGAGADRFTIVTAAWVTEALATAPAWSWPVKPDALWLDSPADLPTLATLADAWIDVQPVSHRSWLPYVGARNLPAAERALTARASSAGNGPRVDLSLSSPLYDGSPVLRAQTYAPAWMGTLTATLHTGAGVHTLTLDDTGGCDIPLRFGPRSWAFVDVEAPASLPWGGGPAWAVSAVRWLSQP